RPRPGGDGCLGGTARGPGHATPVPGPFRGRLRRRHGVSGSLPGRTDARSRAAVCQGVAMAAELVDLTVADAGAWRAWLEEHHTQPDGVWLTLAKKGTTTPTSLRYAEALEEALCFGWIDGQARPGDGHTYSQRFTPRRPRSRWSKRNVE